MSTEKTGQINSAQAKLTKNPDVVAAQEKQQPAIERIKVNALRIDESFDGDHDPYNSTGQHLADRIRDRYGSD
ncbi:MAG: hypothetical protein K0U72_12480 [Gammaproteobacteria bacterium]|nr:hypothetical protein [Gammaproteobacteria bacterium]